MPASIIKEAASVCKTIMRNGFDAYIVNAALQEKALALTGKPEVDICTDMPSNQLGLLFETLENDAPHLHTLGRIVQNEVIIHVFSSNLGRSSDVDVCVAKMTPRLL